MTTKNMDVPKSKVRKDSLNIAREVALETLKRARKDLLNTNLGDNLRYVTVNFVVEQDMYISSVAINFYMRHPTIDGTMMYVSLDDDTLEYVLADNSKDMFPNYYDKLLLLSSEELAKRKYRLNTRNWGEVYKYFFNFNYEEHFKDAYEALGEKMPSISDSWSMRERFAFVDDLIAKLEADEGYNLRKRFDRSSPNCKKDGQVLREIIKRIKKDYGDC